jgi:hypothetical protein
MAEPMFKEEHDKQSKKTWKALVIGAAVPVMMFAGTPAASAAEADPAQVRAQAEALIAEGEQAPALPGVPDPTALLDLQACLTELQGLIAQLPPPPAAPPAPVESEQLPGLPLPDPGAPAVPDIGALTEVCKQVVEVVKGLLPPVPDAPVEQPALPRSE